MPKIILNIINIDFMGETPLQNNNKGEEAENWHM